MISKYKQRKMKMKIKSKTITFKNYFENNYFLKEHK